MGETGPTAAATTTTTSSRLAMRTASGGGGGGGEIVEVQGGHIVRSTGRKDRHSKVCTAKGPRDRRVRLSAHTAIQFYDVQDRLGYDRPSKAVDWLIKKAKASIDELAELPAWIPTTAAPPQHQLVLHRQQPVDDPITAASSSRREAATVVVGGRISEQQFHTQQLEDENNKYNSGSGFLPLDTDIADTIKSFFPMEAATASFHNYPPPPDLLSRTTSQDLRLSLQSFQDPILLQHHQAQTHHHHEQVLFAGNAALGFDGGSSGPGWSEQQHHHHMEEHEQGRLQRLVAWNAAASADSGNSGHGGGFIFNSPSPAPASVFGHGQYFSQRGPLQSSNTPSVRAWIDPSIAAATVDHHQHHYLSPAMHQSFSGVGFAGSGGFSGFRIPARIQGEEEHDGVSDKPSSASSDSRH